MKHHNNESEYFQRAFDSLTSRLFTKKCEKQNVLKCCSKMGGERGGDKKERII